MSGIHHMLLGSAAGEPVDPYFQNTTLLLHGDGTNGAQNNTFLDSSTNGFSITRNGTTTQGTFSPFSKPDGRWGAYFDNTGDYLTVASNAAFDMGTGDFTWEAWVYIPSDNSGSAVFAINGAELFLRSTANGQTVAFYNGSVIAESATSYNFNQWNHVAVTRSGTTLRVYLNGVSGTSATHSSSVGGSASTLYVGSWTDGSSDTMFGWISNARIVKGTAVYTGASFTVPTTPLTAISNTSLLVCQSNRFIDKSTNAFAITRNGDTFISPFSPFPLTEAYSPSVNGGGGSFLGASDYLSCTSNAAYQFNTSDFTVECWLYTTELQGAGAKVFQYATDGNFSSGGYGLEMSSTTTMTWGRSTGSVTLTSSAPVNQWFHFALVRSSGTLTAYINGTSVYSASDTYDYNYGGTYPFTVGSGRDGSGTYDSDYTGYISNFRVVKGSAVYTTAFTPPTAPLTAITNTSLLLSFTNAGILDNTCFNNLETVGNAQIDTTTKKYGTGSIEFDGNGDYLAKPVDQLYAFGTGDFTIECWYWKSANGVNGYDSIISTATDGNGTNGYFVELSATRGFFFQIGSTNYTNTTTTWINDSTWHHFALSRSGTTLRYFIDGEVKSTFTSSDQINANGAVRIGASPNASNVPTYFFNGYIDDLRITKGVARYTGNFTPPTEAFPNIGE